jgi:hypothetical protein
MRQKNCGTQIMAAAQNIGGIDQYLVMIGIFRCDNAVSNLALLTRLCRQLQRDERGIIFKV